MDLKGKIVCFLGDSITEGGGASSGKYAYVSQFEKITKVKKVLNYGICGTRIARQTTPSQNRNFDRDFMSRVSEMDEKADVVVVFGGTNDFGHGDAKIGTFESRDPYTFYGACHILLESLMQKYYGKPIVVITPLHCDKENIRNQNGHVLKTYVDVLKEVACFYSIPVLDLYAQSGLQPAVPAVKEKLMPDGLHPSDAGHAILANRIKGFLESL